MYEKESFPYIFHMPETPSDITDMFSHVSHKTPTIFYNINVNNTQYKLKLQLDGQKIEPLYLLKNHSGELIMENDFTMVKIICSHCLHTLHANYKSKDKTVANIGNG